MGQASQRDGRIARIARIAATIPEHVSDVIEVCRAVDGKWYWHKRSLNGRIVGDSGQGFRRKWSAKRSPRREANASTPALDVIVVG